MSDRRQALFGRYKARSLERLRRLSSTLIQLEEGTGGDGVGQEVARELHTLKGDSTVIGQTRVSELAHAAETLFLNARASPALDAMSRACVEVRKALDVIQQFLEGGLGATDAADGALVAARERLAGETPARKEELPSGLAAADIRAVSDESGDEPAQASRHRTAEAATFSPPAVPEAPATPVAAPVKTPVKPHAEQAQAALRRPAPKPAESDEGGETERWVQVNAARVDHVCEHVSDFAASFRSLAFGLSSLSASGAGGDGLALRPLVEALDRSRTQLEDLISSAWSLRLVTVEPALEELVKHARDLARQQGKQVRVYVRGEGAEVERSVLDALWEPLLHLVRNAVNHGVERPEERNGKSPDANLVVQARATGPNLTITVADDGRGVDVAAVREVAVKRGIVKREAADAIPEREVLELLFMHGFSTKAEVTEVSGRGVGLDIVRERVESLGGSVVVTSTQGQGTRFELTVPATIGKERALVIECAGGLYGIPSGHVLEVVRTADADAREVAGGRVLRYRNETLPLKSLAGVLAAEDTGSEAWAMVVEHGNRKWAFGIAHLVGEYELIRRPLDMLLAPLGHVAASATLDDGRLVLLVSIGGLVRRAEADAALRPVVKEEGRVRKKVLVVDDSPTIREVVSEILADAGLEVKVANDGREALQIMEEGVPDLVMSDLEMPVMDGFELLSRIRARWKHLPVIMLTTRGSAEDRRQATALGADAYLVKSNFEEAVLMDTVRRFFGKSE